MAEISQGKKYGHEINFHGPYLDGQINLNFHVVSSSDDQITTIKEIADLIREDGTIPATGNYTYYEKQEEKKEELEVAKDETPGATPRPIMKTVSGIQVDGDGIKPIFTKEENRVEPRIMMMSVASVSATDDTIIYPTILSADAPAVLADTSDDSKLLTFGNLKKFAELTDARYVQLKSGDPAPGSYATSTDLSTLEGQVIKKGTLKLYDHVIYLNGRGVQYMNKPKDDCLYQLYCHIINDDATPFTANTFYDYLNTSYSSGTTREWPVTGCIESTTYDEKLLMIPYGCYPSTSTTYDRHIIVNCAFISGDNIEGNPYNWIDFSCRNGVTSCNDKVITLLDTSE